MAENSFVPEVSRLIVKKVSLVNNLKDSWIRCSLEEGSASGKAFCLDVTQGHMNRAPNETRTHSCRVASLACWPLHHQRHSSDGLPLFDVVLLVLFFFASLSLFMLHWSNTLTRLILSKCYSLDLPLWYRILRIHGFRPTWPYLIIEFLATWAKILESSGIVINCAFIFLSTNVFDCFHNIIV